MSSIFLVVHTIAFKQLPRLSPCLTLPPCFQIHDWKETFGQIEVITKPEGWMGNTNMPSNSCCSLLVFQKYNSVAFFRKVETNPKIPYINSLICYFLGRKCPNSCNMAIGPLNTQTKYLSRDVHNRVYHTGTSPCNHFAPGGWPKGVSMAHIVVVCTALARVGHLKRH